MKKFKRFHRTGKDNHAKGSCGNVASPMKWTYGCKKLMVRNMGLESFSLIQAWSICYVTTLILKRKSHSFNPRGRQWVCLWTPKFHCEPAGEGIEYSWGCAKNSFMHRPLSDKRKKDNFRRTVRQCLLREVLSTSRVCKFSKHAWEYMCTYHALHA